MRDGSWLSALSIITFLQSLFFFFFFRFCRLCTKLQSVGLCLWGKVYCDAMHFFRSLNVNLLTVQRIKKKELYESIDDYEGIATWKTHVPSPRHGNVWVLYQAVNVWRHSVFLIQDEKGPMFITGHERLEQRPHNKAFPQIQASSPTKQALVFLRWEKMVNS